MCECRKPSTRASRSETKKRSPCGARRETLAIDTTVLTESVLLSTLGGLVGLAIAYAGLIVLKAFIPEKIFRKRATSLST